MRKFLKIMGRMLGLAVIGVFCLIVVANIALFATVQWFNAKGGQAWLKDELHKALAGSAYIVNYDSLHYGLNGLAVTGIEIGDKSGAIAQIDRLSMRFGFLQLFRKQAALSIAARHAVLHRLPDAGENIEPDAEPARLAPFTLPDIYFKSLALDDFSVKKLDIEPPVFGKPVSLAPRIRAKLILGQTITASLRAKLGRTDDNSVAWLPEKIVIQGALDSRALHLTLSEFLLENAAYEISAGGRAGLGPDGDLDLRLDARSRTLSSLLPGQRGRFNILATLTGSHQAPLLALKGLIALDQLQERGLSEINFTVEGHELFDKPAGTARIETSYQDKPFTLAADFRLDNPVLGLSNIDLAGPDLTLVGHLDIDTKSFLTDGAARIEAKNLAIYGSLIDRDIDGKIAADFNFSHDINAKQAVAGTLHLSRGRYDTYFIETADVKAAIPDIAKPWPQTLDLSLHGIRAAGAALENLSAHLKNAGGDKYRLLIDGKGSQPQAFTVKGGADLAGLAAGMPAGTDIDIIFKSRGSSVRLAGALDRQKADISLSTQDFLLRSLPVTLPDALRRTRLTGSARLQGPLDKPAVTADFSSLLSAGKKTPGLQLTVEAAYKDDRLQASLGGSGPGVTRLQGSAALPLQFSLLPFVFEIPPQGVLSGGLNFNLDTAVLANMVLPPDHRFSGIVKGDIGLKGTLARPDIGGALSLNDGRYFNTPYDIGIYDLALQATLKDFQVTLSSLTAHDGEAGRLQGSGVVDLKNADNTALDLLIDNFHLLRSDKADGTFGARLAIRGQPDGYLIGGTIDAGQVDIAVPEQFQSNIPQLNIVTPQTANAQSAALRTIALDIDLNAPRRVFVRGWGLDAEFGGDLAVTGALNAPLINGSLGSIRGRYDEFGKRFNLKKANLRFQGKIPPSPYLDIEATTDAEDVMASITLTGPAAQPAIGFTSVPALPKDEILSRILFGESMSRITPFQAIQLSQTLRRLSGHGGGGFDPLGRLRSATGLDDIRVDTNEAGESSVGVGKYLTDKVYLEVEKGRGENSGAATIEIELTPGISAESKIGQDAQGGGGIIWSRDY